MPHWADPRNVSSWALALQQMCASTVVPVLDVISGYLQDVR